METSRRLPAGANRLKLPTCGRFKHGRWRLDESPPSLSLAPGEQVPLLLKCHAGCSFEEVMAVLRGERPAVRLSGHSGRRRRRRGAGSGPVHWYDYRDEAGRLLYQHGRTPEKEFPFRMPGAARGGLQPEVRRVLYRLPALAAAAPGTRVFVVEGEKDADRLAGLGLVATCNDNGAGRWPEGCDHHFQGLHVVVLPDNDRPGKAHGKLVAQRLAPMAASVRIVTLPGLPEKGDVSDWLDAGHTRTDLLRQCRPAAAPAQEGKAREAAMVAGRAQLLVKLNAQMGAERIAPYRGMAKRTVGG